MVTLTDADIKRINRNNKISFRRSRNKSGKEQLQKLKEYVDLRFAVLVRNLQLNHYEGEEFTESTAIDRLTKEGMNTDHIHFLLGLQRKTRNSHRLAEKHLQLFNRKKSVLLYSDAHIVTVSYGYYDDYGKASRLNRQPPMLEGKKANAWYELK